MAFEMKTKRTKVGILLISLIIFCRHAEALAEEAWVNLMEQADSAREQGEYKNAEILYNNALGEAKKFGAEGSRVGITLTGLACLLNYEGQYPRAEAMYKQALHIEEQTLEPSSPHLADCLNKFAVLLGLENKYAQAIDYAQKAIAIYAQTGQANSRKALLLKANLANLKSEMNAPDALSQLKQNLSDREKVFGPDDTDVAQSLNNLAGYYDRHGQYAEAEPLLRRSLQICIDKFGSDNQWTLVTMHNLAECLCSEKKYNEALPLLKEAMERREKILGYNHPDTIDSRTEYNSLQKLMATGSISKSIAGNSSVQEVAPNLPSTFVVWPRFYVSDLEPFTAGKAFAVQLDNGRKVLISCLHLFGPLGGLDQHINPQELPTRVMGVDLLSLDSSTIIGKAGKELLKSGQAMDLVKDGNYTGDLVAFDLPVDAPLGAIPIISNTPSIGTPVWLITVFADDNSNSPRLCSGKITSANGKCTEVSLDAPIKLQACSGAPVVNGQGELVGMLLGGYSSTPNKIILNPGEAIHARLLRELSDSGQFMVPSTNNQADVIDQRKVLWDLWHNKIQWAVHKQVFDWRFKDPHRVNVGYLEIGSYVQYEFLVGRDGQIKNIQLIHGTGNLTYDGLVRKSIEQLNGSALLSFPVGSERNNVKQVIRIDIKPGKNATEGWHKYNDNERKKSLPI